MKVKYDDILLIYNKYIYKGCNNKRKLLYFEEKKMQCLDYISHSFNSNNYVMNDYNIFLIKYPKYRIVMSLNMTDKVINHILTLNYLIPKFEKYLDYRNIATRKDMGTDYGVKLLKKFIEKNKDNKKLYVLKLDIKKYFYNIDHEVLLNLLEKDLTDDEKCMVKIILNSTNKNYINETIIKIKNNEILFNPNRKEEIMNIPTYLKGKGLPIGNMTSQFFAIFYLYKLDHYIIHDLKLKYMIRYMDDYVIISSDKKYLKKCMLLIEQKLNEEYKLEINKKKCKIYDTNIGFDFLGYRVKVIDNKTLLTPSKDSITSIKKRLKLLKKKDIRYKFASYNNYVNSFKYSKSDIISNIVDNYDYSICNNEFNM